MLYEEFETLCGKEVEYEEYERWNALYMTSNMDKHEFCSMIKKSVTAKPKQKKEHIAALVRETVFSNGNTYYVIKPYKYLGLNVKTGIVTLKAMEGGKWDTYYLDEEEMNKMYFKYYINYFPEYVKVIA